MLLLLAPLFSLIPMSAYAAATDSFPIIGTLHAGKRPEALAVDEQTHMLYIGYESPALVVGFDPISGNVRWRTPLGDSVMDVQADSVNHRVYATSVNYDRKQTYLYLLDGATGHVQATLPAGFGDGSIAYDFHHQHVYLANQNEGNIYIFTFPATGTIPTQSTRLHVGSHPSAIGVNGRLGRLYVADSSTNTLAVLDEDSGRRLATIPIARLPLPPLRIDESTGRVYIVCSTGQEMDVIDGQNNTVLARVAVAPYPEGIAFHTSTGRIYVADEGNNEGGHSDQGIGKTITVIDGQSFAVLGTLRVGSAPDGVEADPALHRVYIALEDSDAVVEMVDSTDIALDSDTTHQMIVAHQTITLLQQATIMTLIAMVFTILGATILAQLRLWRAQESPRTPPDDVSARSKSQTPLL
jgi:DNA-binding beta-propeller fold protein YncE